MKHPVRVALCFDSHLALPAALVVGSVMRRCSQSVHFHLLIEPAPGLRQFLYGVLAHFGAIGTIVEATPETEINIDDKSPYGVPSSSTYRRLFLAELLPDLDRLIYLDCDVIVRHDLTELWLQPLDDYLVGAVPDAWVADNQAMRDRFRAGYFNAGVMLMDLRRWRDQNILRQMDISVPESLSPADGASSLYEQGPLNEVLVSKWKPLSPRWNFTPHFTNSAAARLGLSPEALTAIQQDPGIVHFAAGYKPWVSDFERLSRYHLEFDQLRRELEQNVNLGDFVWPGPYFGSAMDRRQRRIRALSLVHRARQLKTGPWVVVAKGLMALDVLSVSREQNLALVGVATDNALFYNGQFGDCKVQGIAEHIRQGCRSFLIADYRTPEATAAQVRTLAASLGTTVDVLY